MNNMSDNTGRTNEKKLLSFIVPTYNCSEFVKDCLESILGQLPENCELITVDDGSEDGTQEILKTYAESHANMQAITLEHKGVSCARNAGLDVAQGEFVSFIDCDDELQEGFLERSLPLTKKDFDLFVFGIERVPISGIREYWTVPDKEYPNISDYADDYVLHRRLLIYSNCNKFYRRSVIEKNAIRFDEGLDYGEDRLFNFEFLSGCGGVMSSSLLMLKYLQRSDESMSTRHIPNFFTEALKLHDAKMNCFLKLSKGTTDEEKLDFVAYDFAKEMERTILRFEDHPEEKAENMPFINNIVFGGPFDPDAPIDILMVLGSQNCKYKIEGAYEVGKKNPGVRYIVSGGNPYMDSNFTEAEFMANWLKEQGVDEDSIFVENRAAYTKQNLEFSIRIIHMLREKTGEKLERIGVLTGGFHIPRTMFLLESLREYDGEKISWFPAYGARTHIDNWYENRDGRNIVLDELKKTIKLRGLE